MVIVLVLSSRPVFSTFAVFSHMFRHLVRPMSPAFFPAVFRHFHAHTRHRIRWSASRVHSWSFVVTDEKYMDYVAVDSPHIPSSATIPASWCRLWCVPFRPVFPHFAHRHDFARFSSRLRVAGRSFRPPESADVRRCSAIPDRGPFPTSPFRAHHSATSRLTGESTPPDDQTRTSGFAGGSYRIPPAAHGIQAGDSCLRLVPTMDRRYNGVDVR